MRLLDAILAANHRALAGDQNAGLHPSEFADSLPVVALTCIDPRLNPLLPAVLAVPENQFIWLRNAGNIITSPLSSTVRSLALACAVKGGREIVIIGHTDCQVCRTSMSELLERLRALGIERAHLPENLTEFFGLFASERQNVLKAAEFVRQSPLISRQIPVHGLLVDIQSGRLESIVNGYQTLAHSAGGRAGSVSEKISDTLVSALAPFELGEMKFPEGRIGEATAKLEAGAQWLRNVAHKIGETAQQAEHLAESVQERLPHPSAAAAPAPEMPIAPPPQPKPRLKPSIPGPPPPPRLRVPIPPKRPGPRR